MSLEIGIARTKSGRSDLTEEQRSICMSCSDKILMWNIIGIQGSRLPVEKIVLSSITIEVEIFSEENY